MKCINQKSETNHNKATITTTTTNHQSAIALPRVAIIISASRWQISQLIQLSFDKGRQKQLTK